MKFSGKLIQKDKLNPQTTLQEEATGRIHEQRTNPCHHRGVHPEPQPDLHGPPCLETEQSLGVAATVSGRCVPCPGGSQYAAVLRAQAKG